MGMNAVTLDPTANPGAHEDDSMADVIKSLTPNEANALWATLIQLNPKLADLR